MKVSKSWLQELVDLKVSLKEVERLLPLRTIANKEITEEFIELDMKGYNRADLLSMRGVAIEVAAITGSEVKFTEPSETDYFWVKETLPKVEVKVENEELAPVYTVAKIEGLKVGPSPADWVKKLAESGVRSINNVADVTNLVMLEYGQPLHSFDADEVKDETIVVRTATKGVTLRTLDGKERELQETDLVIADPEKALGLAGVMGGKDSEISEKTTSILLEAAIFEPKNLRKTTQRLGLPSEASKRFQHGLTRKRLLQALNAAVKLYQELGGKVTGLTIVGDTEDQLKKVPLSLEKVNSLIGIELSEKQVEEYLSKLHFEFKKIDGSWVVTPPYFRLDIEIEEDLIEEIARMYGYERIPAKELLGETPEKVDQGLFEVIYQVKASLAEAGLTEVQTYSFVSTQVLKALGFNESNKDALVRVANPISSETEYLREFIWPNLIEVVEKNMKNGFEDIAVFEVGKVYSPQKEGLPKEGYRLAIALMNGSENPIEELNSLFSRGAKAVHLRGVQVEKGGLMKELEELFHPKRFATVKSGEKIIGGIAEVHPRFLNQFGIEKRVAILEITLP